MTDIHENKRIVLDCLNAFKDGDRELLRSVMADDAEIWVPEGTRFSGTYTPDFFMARLGTVIFPLAAGAGQMEVLSVTAEEDRVSVEAQGHLELKDGRLYANKYHYLFKIRDGMITSMKEYLNTRHVVDLFG